MSTEDALKKAIAARPTEDTPKLVFADFLQEQDRFEEAAAVRRVVAEARRPKPAPEPTRCDSSHLNATAPAVIEARVDKLLTERPNTIAAAFFRQVRENGPKVQGEKP